jgi:hypothetical protein
LKGRAVIVTGPFEETMSRPYPALRDCIRQDRN